MKHLKRFNESEDNGPVNEYTTEDMDAFMLELIDLMEWSSEETPRWKRNQINMPSAGMRNASSISHSKEEALDHWEAAKRSYGNEDNLTWYVWHVEAGGAFTKIKPKTSQRYDLDEIIKLVRKYPEAIRRVQVSFNSRSQEDFAKMMIRDYYSGGPGSYTGD